MANNFISVAFWLTVARAEASLLNTAGAASEMLDLVDNEGGERQAVFDQLGDAFAAAFPPKADDPFGGFLELFGDADYPTFDCHIQTGPADEQGCVEVYFGGDQVAIDPVAELIRRCCPSALPCGFEYASTCDRLRAGEFGGGYVVITAEACDFHNSAQELAAALDRLAGADRPVSDAPVAAPPG